MTQKKFDDYALGEQFTSFARTITETDLVNFTNLAGLRLPIFIDEEFCRTEGRFGRRVCPGLLTASIAAGMLEDIFGKYTLAALGLDNFVFTHPVFPGDTLHTVVQVTETTPTASGERGVLGVRVNVYNQKDELPCTFTGRFLMQRAA